jgi:Flp pilus assembly protein TadG
MKNFAQRLCQALQKFNSAERGNVLMTFTLAIIPIMGFVGAAVDYSRANSNKAAMQAAVDATALALSKNVASLQTSQINQQTTDYFNSVFNRTDVSNIVLTPTYTTSGGTQLVLTATGIVPATFLKIMGFSTLNINVTSTIKWGDSRLRVALVLDNTGSMAQSSKMTALKTAAKNLLTQLQSAATQNGDVYVSIIPFAKDVNADPVNYSQIWVKWSGSTDTWDENNGTCSKSGYTTKSTCVAQGTCSKSGYTTPSTCVAQGTCSKSSWTTQSTCTSHKGTWTPATWTVATWTPDNHNTWTGCVMDRDQNYDTTNDAPIAGTPATLFPAEQYSSYCPTPLMALSYDWIALSNKIDAMQPNGGTNQAIGLQWGYQSLTTAPFSIPALSPAYKYQQVIVLLTDGLNTQDRWYGDGSTPSPQVDARQQILCNNINAAGITLYTVQVNTNGDPTSTLLQNCAGSPGKYPDASKFFLLTSSSQIITTFNQIGTALSSLRVAK